MIFNWTPELINESLDRMTDHQRAALDCFMSLDKNQERPGPVRLKKHGFSDLADYEKNLAAAREIAQAHFAEKGIRRIDDLAFIEPDRSAEGRIQRGVQKAVCKAAA